MKNKYIFCFVLLCLQYETIAQGGLRITWPLDRTVFQRDANGGTDVWFAGEFGYQQLANGGSGVQYYVYPVDKQTGVRSATAIVFSGQVFVNVSNALSSPHGNIKTFFGKLGRLNTGWYDLEVSVTKNIVCGFASNRSAKRYVRFGVGDVFITSGQSNSSGYTFNDDAGSIPHHTTNLDIPDAVNFLNGSFLSFRNIQNKPDNEKIQMPRALPINANNNSKEFRHKFYALEVTPTIETPATHPDQNEVNIYPNGQSSWTWAPMAYKMYQNGNQVPMMFFNAAWPGSSSYLWNPEVNGNINNPHWIYGQFRDVLLMYGHIFGVKRILWQQGEDDRSTFQADYESRIGKTISQSRNDLGHTSLSWSIAKSTYDGRFNPNILGDIQQAQQNLANANKLGASTDDITNWDNNNGRGTGMKVHFSGAAHNTVGERWANTFGNNTDGTPFTGGQELQQLTITDNGSTFRLNAPTNFQRYYWVKNENGLYNAENTNANHTQSYIDVPKSSNTVDYYTCYMSNDIDDDATNGYKMRMFVSQSFVVPNAIDAGQTLDLVDTYSWNAPKVYSTKIGKVSSKNVDWVSTISQNAQSWLSTTLGCGFDGLTEFTIVAQENTGTSTRYGTITITGSNGEIETIPVEQSATTGCQNTPLTNLSPTNSSGEWQGWGTMQINKSIEVKTLSVGAYTTTVGIGTHANSRIVYNLGGQYNTFSGSVGRDDEADNCNCGTMKIQFEIKADGVTLFTSNLLGTTDAKQDFSVNVAGKNNLELIVNDGGDSIYGDHADWLDPVLSCGTSTCTTPTNPSNAYASSPTITSGQSTQLNVTCTSAGSAGIWSNGASGNTINVSPTTTTTYTVRCKNGICESAGQASVTVTVGTTPPTSGLTAGTCYTISSVSNLSNNMQAMSDGSIQRQGATGAANQIWRAETGSAANQLKFVSAATNQYITVNTPNYADHMYLASSSNNYQSWNIETSGGYYRLSIPAYNTTWDMEGAGGGQYLQNYGNTSEGFTNWRLWRFQATTCPNTTTSGLTNNSCYVIRSVQTNNPLQAMSDGKIQQQAANGQNNQIWKAEASGSQYMFKGMSNNQYIRVNDSNNGTKMELGAAMAFDIQANGASFRISKNATTWDMEGAGSGLLLQNWGITSEPFYNYRLWSFLNVGCPSNTSTNCTNRYLTAGEAVYASTGYGTVNTNLNQAGTAMKIGGATQNSTPTTYVFGVGTHASSEIIYELGSHSFTKLKADVGRDWNAYFCNCGGQSIVFKVINDTNGQVLAGPISKTIWQTATPIEATITGISRIKLIVEDGGDQPSGDWANWANARLECPSVNMREAAITPEEWFWVSPNPNDGKFIAKVNLKTPQSVQLYLSDIKGNIIKEYTFVGVEGMNNFEINIQDKITIESIYNIRCQAGEASDSKRVIIEN